MSYDQEIDPKKGKPCAKNVQVEGGLAMHVELWLQGAGGGAYGQKGAWGGGGGAGSRGQGTVPWYPSHRSISQVKNFDVEKGFGFITQDGGDSDLQLGEMLENSSDSGSCTSLPYLAAWIVRCAPP